MPESTSMPAPPQSPSPQGGWGRRLCNQHLAGLLMLFALHTRSELQVFSLSAFGKGPQASPFCSRLWMVP